MDSKDNVSNKNNTEVLKKSNDGFNGVQGFNFDRKNIEKYIGVQITFENLSYKVENRKYKKQLKEQKEKINSNGGAIDLESDGIKKIEKEKTILNNVSGVVEKGEMVALMGQSGSGKSTLLDILAKRKSTGKITGKILVNGKEIGDAYKKYCSYVTQEDTLLETSTVEETLKFYADLKLPDLNEDEKMKRVYQVLSDVGLSERANSKIGGILPGGMILKGLSGGEKKRVSIGCALVTNPSLLLLDEPTSGLDSTSALVVMRVLKNLTEKGVTVVSSIHQPSQKIFNLFNKVIVVVKGRILYIGSDVKGYLDSLGFINQEDLSTPDFCLDACNDIAKSSDFENIITKWEKHYREEIAPTICNDNLNIEIPKTVSIFYQYKVLQERAFKNFFRNKVGLLSRIVIAILIGLLLSTAFGGLENNQEDILNTLGYLFFFSLILHLIPFGSITLFLSIRTLFNAERASKIYTTLPFFLGPVLIEMVFGVLISFIAVIISYSISHLRWDVSSFILTYIVYLFIHLFSVLMIVSISNITGTVDLSFTYATGLSITFLLYTGFFITIDQLPRSFQWIHYLNPLHYGFVGLMIAQYKDREIECPINSACLYPNGNALIEHYSFENYTYGEALGILIVWTFAYFCLALFGLHYFNKEKR
ncbi:hypothetical protein DICPUDRAFT_27204 [Dictyostelium purpureum]|uniref:ABC transporter domain-containing protein n=1 Tax=Dictyostelium purpureum TaxID=5786 RepID=F0Z9U3_DICPU|nr:uncharacterized protein DICPUDRAFT_27204 [Dictyostelium purpureum]EGC39273.1 hypothetical protein DICPUDRAFT_27204 [Dictyostelium purpureum]|eukprot:XP_003284177.1 hypothetical protein DICPUDRAFT_27204 [Dictyostelium purpureum]